MRDDSDIWIELPGDQDTPELTRLTAIYRKQRRPTPGIVASMKPSPDTLKTVIRMNYAVTFGGSVLGQRREELIAASVSALNDCFY